VFEEFKISGVDSFVIKEWWSNCNILNFYVSHSSAAKFLRGGEKYTVCRYMCNSLLFPTVNNFRNQLTADKVIAKSSTPRFLKHSV